MMIQPRRALLAVWDAILKCSTAAPGDWTNPGRDGANSISDAEQLVCLLYPALKVPDLGFSVPDDTGSDVLRALSPLGDWAGIPRTVTAVIEGYLDTYSDSEGRPVFPPGSYLRPLTPDAEPADEQRRLETVEAYSMSVTLSLSALAFVKSFAKHVRGTELTETLGRTERALNVRLTHAMRGLLNSFTVDVFPQDSPKGAALLQSVDQRSQPWRTLLDGLRSELQPIRAGLLGLALPEAVAARLGDESLLFQCGWAWGPMGTEDDARPLQATADPVPSLYFTVAAMDGIVDFFASQTARMGLLGPQQQTLVHDLRLRWELTQSYWTALARFGGGRWPLKDMRWRVGDYEEDEESDYVTLQVASVVVHNLMRHRGVDDVAPVDDLRPLVDVLEELADRGGITRRPSERARTVQLHDPGELLPLPGADRHGGPPVGWRTADYTPMLLKRMLQVAGLTQDLSQRDRLLSAADALFDHLWRRRLTQGRAAGLWDSPSSVFGTQGPSPAAPSWYLTERVVEVLVVAASTVSARPARSPLLLDLAGELLREAEHLFAQEMMSPPLSDSSAEDLLVRIEADLREVRDLVELRPGTAVALAQEALRDLHALVRARTRATRGG
ncbi:SCO2524 family protein [Streptomyces sp. NBC_00280]|uniref:SCO2524 family protein n=1 Tax=Streptomyces sp. NBC_00280 TaxID=2975699 RepID=UPI003254A9DD